MRSGWVIVVVGAAACDAAAPPRVNDVDPATQVTMLPPEEGAGSRDASSPRPDSVSCRVRADELEPTRGYCFVYRDRPPEVWRRLCAHLSGHFIVGECPSEGHVGTCLLDDGTARWSYTPATPKIAKAECDQLSAQKLPPATFHAPSDDATPLHVSVHACVKKTGTCQLSRYSTRAGLEYARERCVGMGENAQSCPTAQLLGWCYDIVPGMDTAYYAPIFDAEGAVEDCEELGVGVFIPVR